MKKSNYVVWPAPSSKFLKKARGPKSLATPGLKERGSSRIRHPGRGFKWPFPLPWKEWKNGRLGTTKISMPRWQKIWRVVPRWPEDISASSVADQVRFPVTGYQRREWYPAGTPIMDVMLRVYLYVWPSSLDQLFIYCISFGNMKLYRLTFDRMDVPNGKKFRFAVGLDKKSVDL